MPRHAPANPLAIVKTIFDRRVKMHGATPQGVFWKNAEGQILRYEILLGIIEPQDLAGGISLNDLGCGYGFFFDIIGDEPLMRDSLYFGYDLSAEMIRFAAERIDDARATLIVSDHATRDADYSFASGTFNMHGGQDIAVWEDCIKDCIKALWGETRKGMAFNMLSPGHSDRLNGLYYADPDVFLDFCKRELSENTTLRADYPLEEWSIFIRR